MSVKCSSVTCCPWNRTSAEVVLRQLLLRQRAVTIGPQPGSGGRCIQRIRKSRDVSMHPISIPEKDRPRSSKRSRIFFYFPPLTQCI
jgi:hypothetical protein